MAALKQCTQCGACLDNCPVFLLRKGEEFSPKAKQNLLRASLNGDARLDWRALMQLAGQCAGCGRCKTACARALSVPEALAPARARQPRWQQYFWRYWIERGGHLWRVAARMAPLAPRALLPKKLGILHASALAMRASDVEAPWLRLPPQGVKPLAGKTFAVFGGCTADRLRPQWTDKARCIVTALGGSVADAPGFTCCGGTYEHAGMPQRALEAAQANVNRWRALGRPALVIFCASCLHSLRQYAVMAGLLPPEERQVWLENLTPLSSLFRGVHVERTTAALPVAAYHSPCHWDGRDEDLAFLAPLLPDLHKGRALCCGFGGVLRMLHPELSRDLAEACWQGLAPVPTVALTGCSGCVMQLRAHAPQGVRVAHWLDVFQV
ncbi:(Fe-S)-binding protein [Desulfovibrio sp.]|uniref:(Fe-S)-binding protein n=1 Tax=Desulfovibrio sp. TaxID=885 RepID=UPI0025C02836|nr:(Fe-S)-binding protein [Desulfovibrio sp.]